MAFALIQALLYWDYAVSIWRPFNFVEIKCDLRSHKMGSVGRFLADLSEFGILV